MLLKCCLFVTLLLIAIAQCNSFGGPLPNTRQASPVKQPAMPDCDALRAVISRANLRLRLFRDNDFAALAATVSGRPEPSDPAPRAEIAMVYNGNHCSACIVKATRSGKQFRLDISTAGELGMYCEFDGDFSKTELAHGFIMQLGRNASPVAFGEMDKTGLIGRQIKWNDNGDLISDVTLKEPQPLFIKP